MEPRLRQVLVLYSYKVDRVQAFWADQWAMGQPCRLLLSALGCKHRSALRQNSRLAATAWAFQQHQRPKSVREAGKTQQECQGVFPTGHQHPKTPEPS